MKITNFKLPPRLITRLAGLLVTAAIWLAATPGSAGTWTALANTAPESVQLMLLLTDGTVMCYDGSGGGSGGDWYKLTPNSSGSYANGTWTTLASMHYTRRFCASQVLRDGRVLMAGGEYGTGTNSAEVYNPLLNTWTVTPATGQPDFVDSGSMLLPDGRVLVYPVIGAVTRGTVIYNPVANTWTAGPVTLRSQNEATWVKLPDDSILTVDKSSTQSERYIPSLNQWINDDTVPVALYGAGAEIGAALLLADGRVMFFGGNGNTAFYTPSGTTNQGTWTAGPVIPNSQACPDAPAAMMVNGKILFTCSPIGAATNVFPSPTSYYEYDPVADAYSRQNAPGGGLTDNRACYTTCLLPLPDGNVLYSDETSQLYVYQPVGSALAAGKPTISSVNWHGDGSVRLTGTRLNGISAGASYGDDLQMDSNYPLIRLTSGGTVHYGRTYDRSSTGVATGGDLLSADFTLPSSVFSAPGTYSLVAVANGNPSSAVTFYGPESVRWLVEVPSRSSPVRITKSLPSAKQ
jgi:hypothetical protein